MSYHLASPSRTTGHHATHPCLHIRNASDAHVLFEAVRLNMLPMIRRRLGPSERDSLRSGEVFVWEEADQKGALERWTDGRRWSQSRMREPFLYYEEKEPASKEEKEAKAARRAHRNSDASAPTAPPSRRQDRPSKTDGLTKQTYSIYVNLGPGAPRKWHLVAYFCGSDYTRMPVIEDYDYLRRIRVPEGIYISTKALRGRSGSQGADESDAYSSSPTSPTGGLFFDRAPLLAHPPHHQHTPPAPLPSHNHNHHPTHNHTSAQASQPPFSRSSLYIAAPPAPPPHVPFHSPFSSHSHQLPQYGAAAPHVLPHAPHAQRGAGAGAGQWPLLGLAQPGFAI